MLKLERHKDIMRILNERKSITVKELCTLLYASPATIRRDLAELERSGMLQKSFGGAVVRDSFYDQLPLSLREEESIASKRKIAARAATLIHPGDTIFIDASTTTFCLAPFLSSIPEITVITNSPKLSLALASQDVTNYSTGGKMLNDSAALVGSSAEKYIGGIYAHSVFFSARGICNNIATDSSKGERDIKIAMIENSKNAYLLCDSGKQGKKYPYIVTNAGRISMLIDENTHF